MLVYKPVGATPNTYFNSKYIHYNIFTTGAQGLFADPVWKYYKTDCKESLFSTYNNTEVRDVPTFISQFILDVHQEYVYSTLYCSNWWEIKLTRVQASVAEVRCICMLHHLLP